jgi:hypothetical protein
MKFLKIAGAALALALTVGMASAASANTYDLSVSAAFPNNVVYGTVTTTQNGANVDVSVTLASGFQFVNTGGPHDVFTFNTNDASFALSDVTNLLPNVLSASLVGTNPAFGTFTIGIDCSSCGNGGSNAINGPLTFTVLNTTLANFVNNTDGFIFSADIVGNGITGAVGNGVPGQPGVPEPATWAMLIVGMGMVGAGMRMRRRSLTLA